MTRRLRIEMCYASRSTTLCTHLTQRAACVQPACLGQQQLPRRQSPLLYVEVVVIRRLLGAFMGETTVYCITHDHLVNLARLPCLGQRWKRCQTTGHGLYSRGWNRPATPRAIASPRRFLVPSIVCLSHALDDAIEGGEARPRLELAMLGLISARSSPPETIALIGDHGHKSYIVRAVV